MEFSEVVYARCSVRSFQSREVPDKDVMELLELAVRAPSAGNRQPWEFVVVKDQGTKDKLAKAAFSQEFVGAASHVVAVCANLDRTAQRYGDRGRNLYSLQDTAAAIMVLLLAATDRGLGACWVGAFDEDAVCNVLHVPSDVRTVALIPIGYPGVTATKGSSRIDLKDLIHSEKY